MADDKKEDSAPEKVELTPEELEAKLAEARELALKEDREKRKQKEKEKRAEERKARGEDEEEEDPAEVIKAAEQRAAEAEQRAAEAEKKSLMADVNVKLRDYLTSDTNLKPYLGNAPDIILHIERALPKDATDQAIHRLIESHTKAFVERSKQGRTGTVQPSISRSKITGIQTEPRDTRTSTVNTDRPFSTVNWHG